MPVAPTSPPRVRGWAAEALERGGAAAERLAHRLNGAPTRDAHVATPQFRSVARLDFEHTIERALCGPDPRVCVLAVRIDHFDILRASHGTAVGREVVAIVAVRLQGSMTHEDALTTLGDDSFALSYEQPTMAPMDLAAGVAARFETPIITSAGPLMVTVSMGVAAAEYTQYGTHIDATMLHHNAQTALIAAQRVGRSQVILFDHALQARAVQSYETERHLRGAIRDGRLGVDYQPIVNLSSGAVVGVETLARWRDDTLGFVSPATFIPVAEECGLIGDLGRRVLAAGIEQCSAWHRAGKTDAMLTVNLSNRQLVDPDLIAAITTLLDHHRLDPGRLCLEITESVVMSDIAASMTILGQLKDLGLCLAIDDFGTGYSSLSYLRRLPVDILKVDQSFVRSVYNRDDRVITKAIIDLAHTLGMTTIAEGVETRLQVEVLHALNCDMAQGFLLHPPSPGDQVDFSVVNFETYSDEITFEGLFNGSRGSSCAPASSTAQFVRQ